MFVRALARKAFLGHNFRIMNPLLKLVCLADLTNILKIVDIALIVLLVVVLVALVLCFLRGLLRGWKYGTYRLIFFAIMVTVVLLTLGAQANALGGMDLSGLHLPDFNMTLTIDGADHAICVKWTNLQDSLEDLIIQIAASFGTTGSYSGLFSYASVMALSLIKLLLIFVWGILLSSFGLLLIMLLWHLIFKRFTPRDRRKVKKLRLVSAFEELLVGAACLGMLITPFSSIANALNSNFKVEDEQAKQNETVSMITDILGVYDKSAFAKTFFSWNSMDGKTTFDQQLISFLTQTEVGQVKSDLVSEVGTLASISSLAINAGLLNAQGSEGIRWYFILSSSSIPALINELAQTTLVQVALPFAVSLAVNLDGVKGILSEETCQYLSTAEVDWEEVLESMGRIYQDILDAGIIDCVVDVENGSSTPSFDWTQLKYVISGKDASGNERDAKGAMHALTSEFEDSQLFSHLMAGLLAQLGKNELEKEDHGDISILDFLPMKEDGSIDYESLVNLNYTKEFNLIYDTFYSINEVSPSVVDQALDFVQNPPTEENKSQKYRDLIAEAALHSKEYTELIVGERDESGNPKADSNSCLMDSVFIGNALPGIVTFMEKAGSSALDMELSFSESKEKLKTLNDYKKEFGAALDVAADFASSEAGYAFLKTGEGMVHDPDGNLISIEPTLVEALQGSMEKIDDSLLMSEALPQVAEHYFDSFKETLSTYGIEQVDFRCENLGGELSYLLNLIKYSGDLMLAVNRIGGDSSYLTMNMIVEESDSLLAVLDIFASSAILNPVLDGKANVNFASLLNHVFSSAGLEDFKIEPEMLEGVSLASERDADFNVTQEHENAAILKVLIDVAKSVPLTELLSLGSASTTEMMKTLSKADIRTMFENIGNSAVMKKVAGSAMDKYILSALDLEAGEDITFKNVTDWKSEGEVIGKLVDLATNGIDISNMDINTISPTLVKQLFSSLAGSQIFQKKEGEATVYKFPEFFSSKILGMLDDSSVAYFADQGKSVPAGASLEEKKEQYCTTFVKNCLALETPEQWTQEGGEIDIFSKILSSVQSLGGFSNMSSFSRSKLPTMTSLLESLASSSAFGQVLLANALGESFAKLPTSDSLDLSLANPDVFFEDKYSNALSGESATKERQREVSALCQTMDVLFDPDYGFLDSDGNFVGTMDIATLSVPYCLRPLLESISSSAVMTTGKTNPDGSQGETMLASLFASILVKSGLYGVSDKTTEIAPSHAKGLTVQSIVSSLSVSEMKEEIDSFCETVELAQNSGLLSSGSLDFSSLDSSSLKKVEDLLGAMNESKLLYRALPIQLDKAIKDISLPSPFKEDLALSNAFVMENAEKTDYSPYTDEEITCLSSIFALSSDFSGLDSASLEELCNLDVSKILSPLYASRVFNSSSGDELTSAQSFLSHILAQMKLKDDLVYRADSPKDSANTSKGYYTDASSKYAYLVSSNLGKGQSGDYSHYSLQDQDDPNNAFYKVVGNGENGLSKLLSNLSEHKLTSLLSGGNIDFKTVSGSSLSALLKDLCRCTLLSDVPVNAFASYLSGGDLSVSGIDLSLANFYYPYSYDSEGHARTDLSATYDENEIDLLVDLLDLIDLNKTSLESGSMRDLDPYLLRQMLYELSDSLLFHQTGPNKTSSTYGLGWDEYGSYDPYATLASVNSDLTVFEQMMYLVYTNSELDSRAFDEYHDFEYYKEEQKRSKEGLGAELKLHANILSASKNSYWAEEISALTTNNEGSDGLIQLAVSSDMLDGDGKVDTSSSLMQNLSPGKAMKFMSSLGKSRVCGDALSTTLSSFLTTGDASSSSGSGLGVGNFSTRTVTLSNQTSFESNSSFAKMGIAYQQVVFTSSSYTGSEAITFKADYDGDSSVTKYEQDLSAYKFDSSSNSWVFATSDLRCDFAITIDNPGELSYSFDAANYYLDYGSLNEGQRTYEALELFLISLHKDSGGYFSFEGDSALLSAAKNIKLYGLCAIIMQSGFYADSFFDRDFAPVSSAQESSFSASSYALYQIFSITPEGSPSSVKLLDAIDEPRLKALYPSSEIPLTAHLSSIEKIIADANPHDEGAFLEQSLSGISLSEGVHLTLDAAFSSSSYSPQSKTSAYRMSVSNLWSHRSSLEDEKQNGDLYEDFLSARKVSYASYTIEDGEGKQIVVPASTTESKSVFADQLIASTLNKRVEERLSYVKLDSQSISSSISFASPTSPNKSRLSFLSSNDQTSLSSFDAYGYDSSTGSYSFTNLDNLIEREKEAARFSEISAKGVSFSSSGSSSVSGLDSYKLTAEEKSAYTELCSNFDSLTGLGKTYINLVYTADVYDYFVFKGSACLKLYQDYFFHGSASNPLAGATINATDFPSTYEDGVLNGVSTSFSYSKLVEVSLSA